MEAAAEAALANGTGDQEREFYEVGASVHHVLACLPSHSEPLDGIVKGCATAASTISDVRLPLVAENRT
jgi:hypothetical protein